MTIDAGRRSLITFAVVFIANGAVFLLRATGLLGERWWALLINASALWFLADAWLRYRMRGRMDGATVVFFSLGAYISLIGLAVYQGWNWGVFWPVFVL